MYDFLSDVYLYEYFVYLGNFLSLPPVKLQRFSAREIESCLCHKKFNPPIQWVRPTSHFSLFISNIS